MFRRSQMSCIVCQEEYCGEPSLERRPKLLPCGHDLCESCIVEKSDTKKKTLKCPSCSMEHGGDLRKLPAVFALIPDKLAGLEHASGTSGTQTRIKNAKTCLYCSNEGEIICPHCARYICKTHETKHCDEIYAICEKLLKAGEKAASEFDNEIVEAQENCSLSQQSLTQAVIEVQKLQEKLDEAQIRISQKLSDVEKTSAKLQKMYNQKKSHDGLLNSLRKDLNDRVKLNRLWIHHENLRKFKLPSPLSLADGRVDADFEWNELHDPADLLLTTINYEILELPLTRRGLFRQPWDVAVVENVEGYKISSANLEIVQESRAQKGKPPPNPAFVVAMWGIHDKLYVFNVDIAENTYSCKLRLHIDDIYIHQLLGINQELCILDVEANCVYRVGFDGHQKSYNDSLTDTECMCLLPNDRLAVTNGNSLTVLAWPSLQHTTTISCQDIPQPELITASETSLYVTSADSNVITQLKLSDFSTERSFSYEFRILSMIHCRDKGLLLLSASNYLYLIDDSNRRKRILEYEDIHAGDSDDDDGDEDDNDTYYASYNDVMTLFTSERGMELVLCCNYTAELHFLGID